MVDSLRARALVAETDVVRLREECALIQGQLFESKEEARQQLVAAVITRGQLVAQQAEANAELHDVFQQCSSLVEVNDRYFRDLRIAWKCYQRARSTILHVASAAATSSDKVRVYR